MVKTLTICIVLAASFWFCYSECPYGVYEYEVSPEEADAIVGIHNKYRLQIARGQVPGQPKGVNLKKLKWDKDLAIAAQNIANTCIFAHVNVEDKRWWWVGQNLFSEFSSYYENGANWTLAVKGWFDEHKMYTYLDRVSAETGHYTQVIWADTKYVGCGYVHFLQGTGLYYQKVYVCNYGPGGNIRGVAPYKTGQSGCENLC